MDNTFRERFRNARPQELVDALNGQVGNPGWVGARGSFLAALKEAFLATGLDCSGFIQNGGMRLVHVRLDGDRVVPTTERSEPGGSIEMAPAEGAVDFPDGPSLIDALIRFMKSGDEAGIQKVGAQLVSESGAQLAECDSGILRRFDELHDLELVETLLDPDPERLEELEDGDDLTEEEMTLFANAVEEECFQADGHNDAWVIARIEDSGGSGAFVAHTISGCSWEGIECTFVGVYMSEAEAKSALEDLGYLDGADFRRRYPTRPG